MSFIAALTTAILPVLAIAATGYLLGTFRDIDVDVLGTITIYVLTPALVFDSFAQTSFSAPTLLKVGIGVILFTAIMLGLAAIIASLSGFATNLRSATMLTSSFPNSGNYGIPLSAFAFGLIGRSTAILFLAVQSILVYSVGVYVASRGEGANTRRALKDIFTLPLIYAIALAGIARLLNIVPPANTTIMETIELTGNAAIPVLLLMLGVQLANTRYQMSMNHIFVPTILKLFIAPLVAIGIALGLQFSNMTVSRVFILECSMPAAITPLLLTVEYSDNSDQISGPEYVSTTIFVTTILSIGTLTILIGLLKSGYIL
ncbi:MAG: AEC family transporter [Halobacteriaceae archaeon]